MVGHAEESEVLLRGDGGRVGEGPAPITGALQLDVGAPHVMVGTLVGPDGVQFHPRLSDVVVGEKDYELMRALQSAITDLHLPVKLHGVPTVRMPDGLALSLRNTRVEESARDQALALAAALTAGAHSAEHGADAVLSVARTVLEEAGVDVDYLEVRGLDLGDAPEQGDARLLVSAVVGGVRLTDNVGLPLGIGFRNIEG